MIVSITLIYIDYAQHCINDNHQFKRKEKDYQNIETRFMIDKIAINTLNNAKEKDTYFNILIS